LGKPWLHEVRAVHDYATDTIKIPTELSTESIANIANEDHVETIDVTPVYITDPNTTPDDNSMPETPKSLDNLLDAETRRIKHLHANGN
jgi:hypothetical protein